MRKSQRTENLATNPKSLETSEHRGGNASLSDCQQGIHKLPVELLDFVMQSLWEDKRSILACSRVSRLWHEVAHPHLFAFLKIASQFDFVGFYAFLHANTDIAGHLRKLQFKHTITTWLNQSELPDGFPGVGRAQLRDLVASLPRLQDLHLYRLWVMSSLNPPPDVLDLLPTHSLEKMTIENCDVPDGDLFPVTVLNIVSLFASVDTVKLVSLCLLILPSDRVRVIRPVNMGTLIITDISLPPQFEASGIYDPLRECLAPGCIRSLEIGCLRSYHLDLWSRDRSGPTDRCAREPQGLRWQLRAAAGNPVGPAEDDPEHWRILNLHACTSLTSLMLEITVPPTREHTEDIPRVPLSDVCIALLANIPATVRVLTMKLWGTSKPAELKSAKTLGLRALDAQAALAERHAHLERVEVMVDTYVVECLEALASAMPQLLTRGMLGVNRIQ